MKKAKSSCMSKSVKISSIKHRSSLNQNIALYSNDLFSINNKLHPTSIENSGHSSMLLASSGPSSTYFKIDNSNDKVELNLGSMKKKMEESLQNFKTSNENECIDLDSDSELQIITNMSSPQFDKENKSKFEDGSNVFTVSDGESENRETLKHIKTSVTSNLNLDEILPGQSQETCLDTDELEIIDVRPSSSHVRNKKNSSKYEDTRNELSFSNKNKNTNETNSNIETNNRIKNSSSLKVFEISFLAEKEATNTDNSNVTMECKSNDKNEESLSNIKLGKSLKTSSILSPKRKKAKFDKNDLIQTSNCESDDDDELQIIGVLKGTSSSKKNYQRYEKRSNLLSTVCPKTQINLENIENQNKQNSPPLKDREKEISTLSNLENNDETSNSKHISSDDELQVLDILPVRSFPLKRRHSNNSKDDIQNEDNLEDLQTNAEEKTSSQEEESILDLNKQMKENSSSNVHPEYPGLMPISETPLYKAHINRVRAQMLYNELNSLSSSLVPSFSTSSFFCPPCVLPKQNHNNFDSRFNALASCSFSSFNGPNFHYNQDTEPFVKNDALETAITTCDTTLQACTINNSVHLESAVNVTSITDIKIENSPKSCSEEKSNTPINVTLTTDIKNENCSPKPCSEEKLNASVNVTLRTDIKNENCSPKPCSEEKSIASVNVTLTTDIKNENNFQKPCSEEKSNTEVSVNNLGANSLPLYLDIKSPMLRLNSDFNQTSDESIVQNKFNMSISDEIFLSDSGDENKITINIFNSSSDSNLLTTSQDDSKTSKNENSLNSEPEADSKMLEIYNFHEIPKR